VPHVQRLHESGLVLAEESADEAGLSRAIKEIDRRYVLQKNPDGDRPDLYVVSCIVSEEEPPIRMLAWADDDGTPLPLSSGLVDEVKKWRPEARSRRGPDADERNRQHRERISRERQEQLAEVTADHRGRVSKGRLTVSMGPRVRLRGWQRNTRPPKSGLGGD
jgi:hypothetical protein